MISIPGKRGLEEGRRGNGKGCDGMLGKLKEACFVFHVQFGRRVENIIRGAGECSTVGRISSQNPHNKRRESTPQVVP